MKCKFCFAELEDDAAVCPVCGKELTEAEEISAETEIVTEKATEETSASPKKDHKGLKIGLAAIGLVLLAEVLLVAVLHFTGVINAGQMFDKMIGKNTATDTTATTGSEVPTDANNNGASDKPLVSYTADNATVEAAGDKVVAKLGNQELTVSELQIHYWSVISDFVRYYGNYVEYMGLSLDEPFDRQVYDEKTGKTFQQWFLENAIESWRRQATLAQLAEDAGYEMTAEQQKSLDNMASSIKTEAQTAGYSDVEAYIDYYYPGSSLEGYVNYNTTMLKAMFYYDVVYEEMLPAADEIEAYYTENEAYFKENKIAKENGQYYDVRHILIPIEGDPVEGTYSDEQWEQCLAKAQKVLDDFLEDGGTEELFAQLAKEVSADPGSASEGGLYTKLTKDTSFIDTFKNWYLEEGRKPGDTGIVKNTQSSTQGYHVMFFCDSYAIWEYEAKSALLSEKTNTMLKEAEEKWPMTVNYVEVVLGQAESKK